MSLANKLDGDELDLSLMRLSQIPVTEIAAIPKAINIDLSNNEIVSVPPAFPNSLSRVVKLDLSSNKLKSLPNNFGLLVNLKHLDLYNNQLTDLPLSLSDISSLKYLDVKNNPLNPDLAKAAGNCLDSKECQIAARKLSFYLRKLKVDKEQEKKLKVQQEKEAKMAKQRHEEEEREKEREKKKADKKAEKERRRQELAKETEAKGKGKQNGSSLPNGGKNVKKETSRITTTKHIEDKPIEMSMAGKALWSVLGLLNILIMVCVLAAAGICVFLYVKGDLSPEGFEASLPRVHRNGNILLQSTKDGLQKAYIAAGPVLQNLKALSLTSLDAIQGWLSSAWLMLQDVWKDSTPYVQGLKTWYADLSKVVVSGVVIAWDWVQKLEWCCVVNGFAKAGNFLADQFRVANEEFWRNEAVSATWKDLKPYRESLWSYTENIRNFLVWAAVELWVFLGRLVSDLQTHWLPVVKREGYNLYMYGKNTIESLIT